MSEDLISLETLLLTQPQDENISWTYRGLHFDKTWSGLQGHLALSTLVPWASQDSWPKGSLLIKGHCLFQDQIYPQPGEVTQEQVEQ